MIRVCAWHPLYFGYQLVMGGEGEPVTHGICPDCREILEAESKPQNEVPAGKLTKGTKMDYRPVYDEDSDDRELVDQILQVPGDHVILASPVILRDGNWRSVSITREADRLAN